MHFQIPDRVRRFVLTSIPSVPHLEALLLLHATGTRPWTLPELARRLYVPETQAIAILDSLVQSGLVDTTEAAGFRISGDEELSSTIAELADCYGRHLVLVTDLIHSKTDRRALRFAEAFRLNREDKP